MAVKEQKKKAEAPVNPQEKLKADHQELKHEHSELGRLYELRGRDLNSARKRVVALEEENEQIAELEKKLAQAYKDNQELVNQVKDLSAKQAKVDQVLEDVAALKRLAG